MTKSVFVFLALLLACAFAQKQCKFSGADAKGNFTIDLTKLAKAGGWSVPGDNDYKYLINFCQGVNQDCKGLGTTYKAIQLATNPALPVPCYYLSAPENQDDSLVRLYCTYNVYILSLFKAATDSNAGAVLNYQSGEPFTDDQGNTVTRETELQIKCLSTNDDTKLTIAHDKEERRESAQYYIFTSSAKAACPVYGPPPTPGGGGNDYPLGQLGIGGLLLIMYGVMYTFSNVFSAGVAAIAYFIIGMIVMKFKFQKAGIEIIPNVYLWKDFPFLLKDGVMLIVDGVQKVFKRGQYAELKDPQ